MAKLTFVDPLLESLAPSAAGQGPGSGQGQGGNGGGGGVPGGGGGQGGGNGGDEGFGNNLSFPVIFPTGLTATLRGDPGEVTFTNIWNLNEAAPEYYYFAQGNDGNEWQADFLNAPSPVIVDYVDIGDALESAPIKANKNVRLELTLYEQISDVTGVLGDTLTGFNMALLEGAKGKGRPGTTGPTELQGARLDRDLWTDGGYSTNIANNSDSGDYDNLLSNGTLYESPYASVYSGGLLDLTIQPISQDDITGLGWNGLTDQWTGPGVGTPLASPNFAPELNIAGKYIVGASGSPFQFPSNGTYIITFSLDEGPIAFDDSTQVANFDPATFGFTPITEGRVAEVIGDNTYDNNNGLIYMLVSVNPTGVI